MFKNFLTIAWRSLVRNKLHSLINIIGLAIGISACLVIYLIVRYELSFNKKHEGYDRIYRVHSSFKGLFSGLNRGVPTAVGPFIRDSFTGIESVVSFQVWSAHVAIPSSKDSKNLDLQKKIIITEPSFFNVFKSYAWIAGSPDVLTKPNQVVLTESRAKTYFGTSDPSLILGKEIIYHDSLSVTLAGVVKDLEFNTDTDMTDFISYSTIENTWLKNNFQLDNWSSTNSGSQLFILLREGVPLEKINTQLPVLSTKYKESRQWDVENNFVLQPLSDVHFNAETGIFDYSRSPAHRETLTILTIVAALLLIIAAINFINLETAQAVKRAKEVGVRKTMGSTRVALLVQFLYQSFIITFIAIFLSLPLTEFSLRIFSDFVPAGVQLGVQEVLPFLAGILIGIGFLAGLYPAFVLSSFLPALALKNQAYANSKTTRSAYFRKALIVFQFSVAQVLIIAALVVGWQINFLLNKDLGFRKDAVINIYTPWNESAGKSNVFRNELSQLTEIEALSLSGQPPSENGWSSNTVEYKPKTGDAVKVNAFRKFGDVNYLDFYGIKLIEGRNVQQADSLREFMINRTLMNQLGFDQPEDAVGQVLTYQKQNYPIVGVVEDFHVQSLHQKVEPVILGYDKNFKCFNIRLSAGQGSGDFKKGLDKIEAAWKKVYPDTKFTYKFLDETLRNFYESEQRTAKLVQTATAMAIFISCLGLFGLASFTTTQRMKEIGIRKVLGSSIRNIIVLLSRDFILLVIIAFVIATPVAWFAVTQWLETFAYHMTLNAWIFLITAIIGVIIAFLTVAYQTVRAASSNPVESLRSE